jgi:hypothetical protein
MIAWFCVGIVSIAVRIIQRKVLGALPPLVTFLMWFQLRWLLLMSFAAVLSIVTWRSASRRFAFFRIAAAAIAIWVPFELLSETSYRFAAQLFPPSRRIPSTVWQDVSNDIVHFSIVALGTIAATLIVRAYRLAAAAEHEAAALEAQISDARVRLLRTQVQPALIRESLENIEMLLIAEPRRAESAVYSLSDYLRLALQRARGVEWDESKEALYVRLEREVTAESRTRSQVGA